MNEIYDIFSRQAHYKQLNNLFKLTTAGLLCFACQVSFLLFSIYFRLSLTMTRITRFHMPFI